MKSFLCKSKKPIIKWSKLPDNIFYEGVVPTEHNLAICPSKGYIILDVDKHGKKNGFKTIPENLFTELTNTYSYKTKNNGKHYWFKYTGKKKLANKASGLGIDLRTHKGYVIHYPSMTDNIDIRDNVQEIKSTSKELNKWLEELFSYNNKIKKK